MRYGPKRLIRGPVVRINIPVSREIVCIWSILDDYEELQYSASAISTKYTRLSLYTVVYLRVASLDV